MVVVGNVAEGLAREMVSTPLRMIEWYAQVSITIGNIDGTYSGMMTPKAVPSSKPAPTLDKRAIASPMRPPQLQLGARVRNLFTYEKR